MVNPKKKKRLCVCVIVDRRGSVFVGMLAGNELVERMWWWVETPGKTLWNFLPFSREKEKLVSRKPFSMCCVVKGSLRQARLARKKTTEPLLGS